jgi:hypothetical protein
MVFSTNDQEVNTMHLFTSIQALSVCLPLLRTQLVATGHIKLQVTTKLGHGATYTCEFDGLLDVFSDDIYFTFTEFSSDHSVSHFDIEMDQPRAEFFADLVPCIELFQTNATIAASKHLDAKDHSDAMDNFDYEDAASRQAEEDFEANFLPSY